MRKVDERTVEFTLTEPNAVFDEALGYYINCIMPQDWSEANPIGTGPFKLTEFKPGEGFKFVRNENYFGQVPWVDELSISHHGVRRHHRQGQRAARRHRGCHLRPAERTDQGRRGRRHESRSTPRPVPGSPSI